MRHVVYYQCDRCGCGGLTEDEIHEVDGEDLCDTCFDEEFKMLSGNSWPFNDRDESVILPGYVFPSAP